jgi:glycosyltransferase involved in cell wall biosynthesis
MHVVQVNYAWDPDVREPGRLLERYRTLTGWSSGLVAAGARTTVVQSFWRNERVVHDDVEYLFREPRGVNIAVAALAPDVAHVNGLVFPVETWMLARKLPARTAIVLQDHAGIDPGESARGLVDVVRHAVRRRSLAAAHAFLFVATAQADIWRRAGLIGPEQPVFEVMEAAPDLRRTDRSEARRRSGIDGDPALLWVGRLNANKDPLAVLDGFEGALRRLPAASLTMVYQGGDLIDRVKSRITGSPALQGRVRLVGAVPHARLASFFSAADLFVLGSHREGSGYALLEACRCGAVPIVTDIPSFRRITGNGTLGALWPAGDAGGFTRALLDIALRDLRALSERVAAETERSFSWPAIGRSAVDAYGQVLRLTGSRLSTLGRHSGI